MGRGIFSGVIWGSVVAVAGLWLAAQLGEMIHILSDPRENVSAEAPEAAPETPVVPDVTPAPPAVESSSPATDPSRQQSELVENEAEAPPETEAEAMAPTLPDEPETPASNIDSGQAPDVAAVVEPAPLAPEAAQPPNDPQMDDVPTQLPEAVTQKVETPETVTQTPPELPEVEIAGNLAVPDTSPVSDTAPAPQAPASESQPVVDFNNPQVVEPPTEPDPVPEIVAEVAPVAVPETGADSAPNQAGQSAQTAIQQPDASPETPTGAVDPADTDVAALTPESTGQTATVRRPPGTGTSTLPGSRSDRLPTIGGDSAESLPDAGADDLEISPELENAPAIIRYAVPFENPGQRPLMAVLLLVNPDDPMAGLPAEPLPFPVSFAIDASAPNADSVSTAYRRAGYEVVAIAPLPDNARPEDVEVAFQSYLTSVSTAVAVMDTRAAVFQSGRPVASQVSEALAATGHGMITYSRGLNSATQVAERDGVPAALVFREFDSDGQDKAAIKRFMDQAAFRAGQLTGVIVVGHDRPETMAALLEWSLGNRASTVALAPVSAVLQAQ